MVVTTLRMISSVTVLVLLCLCCVTGLRTPVLNDSVQIYPSLDQSGGLSPLYFGLMAAPSEDSDYVNATVKAIQLALDEINDNSDLLRGYSLHYTLTVSQVTFKY